MPHSNLNSTAAVSVSTHGNNLNCHIKKTYQGPQFTPVGKLGTCDHHDTRMIEGYDRTPRGRIDAEVCNQCGEVLSQKVIR